MVLQRPLPVRVVLVVLALLSPLLLLLRARKRLLVLLLVLVLVLLEVVYVLPVFLLRRVHDLQLPRVPYPLLLGVVSLIIPPSS